VLHLLELALTARMTGSL